MNTTPLRSKTASRHASANAVPAVAGAAAVVTAGGAPIALVRDVLDQLAGLHAALQELVQLAKDKLTAMRRADSAALQALAAREAPLVTDLFRREPVRKASLARLAQALQCPDPEHPRLSILADRLPEPLRSTLRARAAALECAALELQRKNRVAASAARNLQAHLRGVFAALAGAVAAPVYGPKGPPLVGGPAEPQLSGGRCWVDAVG